MFKTLFTTLHTTSLTHTTQGHHRNHGERRAHERLQDDQCRSDASRSSRDRARRRSKPEPLDLLVHAAPEPEHGLTADQHAAQQCDDADVRRRTDATRRKSDSRLHDAARWVFFLD